MKFRLLLLMCLSLFAVTGCGYRLGFTGHPQIGSLGVAPVDNETLLYNASGTLRALLCERIMNDGTYKLKRENDADCVIHARVVNSTFNEISWTSSNSDDTGDFFPEYYKVTVTVEYSVILPGKLTPLIGPAKVTGEAMFDHVIDLETARRNGVKQALWDATKKIIDGCTEAW